MTKQVIDEDLTLDGISMPDWCHLNYTGTRYTHCGMPLAECNPHGRRLLFLPSTKCTLCNNEICPTCYKLSGVKKG